VRDDGGVRKGEIMDVIITATETTTMAFIRLSVQHWSGKPFTVKAVANDGTPLVFVVPGWKLEREGR
jgi:hypothetical protein